MGEAAESERVSHTESRGPDLCPPVAPDGTELREDAQRWCVPHPYHRLQSSSPGLCSGRHDGVGGLGRIDRARGGAAQSDLGLGVRRLTDDQVAVADDVAFESPVRREERRPNSEVVECRLAMLARRSSTVGFPSASST